MDSDYKYSMSITDQEKFVNIERGSKYGELLRGLRQNAEDSGKQINFNEQSSSKFVLSKISGKIMQETITAFPIDLPLNDRSIYNYSEAEKTMVASPEQIYDVRFIMPLLYHSVSPSLFVDCRDFIARRCLALTLTGLSSEDPQMRALCYKILERFYEHLLSTLLIDKQLWINFLDIIKNSIPAPNTRLRFIFTNFLVKIIDVLLHPVQDKLFELIKEFLSGRPRFRVDTIELYDDLLMCEDVEYYGKYLRWLFTLFRDGIKSQNDVHVLVKLRAIPHIMCLFNSQLRFERANQTICSILIRIASLGKGSRMLVTEYSLLPWLHQTILHHLYQENREAMNDKKLEGFLDTTTSLASVVFTLVDSLLKNKDDQILPLPRLLELVNVFILLHDLIIKSKNIKTLEYYLNYVGKVARQVKNDERIPSQLTCHILKLIKAKMPYLA